MDAFFPTTLHSSLTYGTMSAPVSWAPSKPLATLVRSFLWPLYLKVPLHSQAGSSRSTELINDITDRLSDITIRPGHSSLVHHRLSSTPSLTAECSSPAAAHSSPSNLGSATFSSSSTEWPSLQECKRSWSKYSQNQLAILCHIQDEILCCNMFLHLPIWCPLLD